jgi:hypothetical protein
MATCSCLAVYLDLAICLQASSLVGLDEPRLSRFWASTSPTRPNGGARWRGLGTYSAKDHLNDHPCAADVILYDRLVIPVPYDLEGGADWQQWKDEGWDPAKQASLLKILGARAYPVSWDPSLQEQ